MGALQIFKTDPGPIPLSDDLDELIRSTERYGKLDLSRMDGGWWARIAMNTNVTGSTFRVESDYKEMTPLQAVKQCIERMHIALKTLGAA